MVTGRPIGSMDAIKTGLAHELVGDADDLDEAMRKWIIGCKGEKPILIQLETVVDATEIVAARDKYLKRLRADHTPAPAAIIDHVENFGHDKSAMSAGEIEAVNRTIAPHRDPANKHISNPYALAPPRRE